MQFTFLYVAVIYVAAVFLCRRFGQRFPWPVALFFYLLVLVFLFQPLTQNYVNVPADYLRRLYPWRGLPGGDLQNRNPEINDVILQMVPWAHQVRTAWRHLDAPVWNFATGGGYPLLANGQSSALAPFRLVALPLELGRSLTCEAALKLLAALSFTYLFMRRRFSEAASVISAVAFAFSTFIVVWLYFPHSAVVSLLPALFFALDGVMVTRTVRRSMFLALVLAAMILSGHPESFAHSVLAGGLFTLAQLFVIFRASGRRAIFERLAHLGAAGAIALLLASPFLLPFLEAMPRSQRYQWLHDTGHSISRANVRSLVPLMHPEFYGIAKKENVWGPGIAEEICGYGGVLGWVGWLALLVALITRRRVSWFDGFLLFALPFFVGAALGWHGPGDLFEHLPLFSLAANGRLRLVVCWLLAILAGVVVDRLRTERRSVAIALAVFLVLFAIPFFVQKSYDWHHVEEAWLTSIPRWIVLAAALLALFALPKRVAHVLLLLTVTFDMWSFGRPWNPIVSAAELYPPTPMLSVLRAEIDAHHQQGLVRIAGTSGSFFPNSAAMYGFEDVRAHDPMANGRYLGALRVFARYTSDEYFGMLNKLDTPYVHFLNVGYVLTSPLEFLEPPWRMIYSERDGRIFQNPQAVPRFFVPQKVRVAFDIHERIATMQREQDFAHTAYVERIPTSIDRATQKELLTALPPGTRRATISALRRTSNGYTMNVDATRWSLIASSSPNFPGWKVFRNGSRLKVIEMNDNFISFAVPPGHSAISVVYQPLSFMVGSWTAIVTALGLVFAFVLTRRRATTVTSDEAAGQRPLQAIMQ